MFINQEDLCLLFTKLNFHMIIAHRFAVLVWLQLFMQNTYVDRRFKFVVYSLVSYWVARLKVVQGLSILLAPKPWGPVTSVSGTRQDCIRSRMWPLQTGWVGHFLGNAMLVVRMIMNHWSLSIAVYSSCTVQTLLERLKEMEASTLKGRILKNLSTHILFVGLITFIKIIGRSKIH